MKKIYIVTGEIGGYDDIKLWLVKAFLNKDKAEEFSQNAYKESKRILKEYNKSPLGSDYSAIREELRKKIKYDKLLIFDFDCTAFYEVKEVEVEGA